MEFDVFVCHASSDREDVAVPLVELLQENGINCWLDQNEIRWGDSLPDKVNEGLRQSHYVIVVLSSSFLTKPWPQREFNAALNLEAGSGTSRVLPLLVGTPQERAGVIEKYPLINDKLYMIWPDDSDRLVNDIDSLLGHASDLVLPTQTANIRNIRQPELARKPTELERHRFVQSGFKEIRDYFAEGVLQLSQHEHIDAEINDIHAAKFTCYAFVSGERRAQCKVWLGGPSNGEQISYSSSFAQIDDDNSYNDWVTVSRDKLSWEASGFGSYATGRADKSMNSEQAASYLWEQFIQPLAN